MAKLLAVEILGITKTPKGFVGESTIGDIYFTGEKFNEDFKKLPAVPFYCLAVERVYNVSATDPEAGTFERIDCYRKQWFKTEEELTNTLAKGLAISKTAEGKATMLATAKVQKLGSNATAMEKLLASSL